jgi:hypothetical protein
MQLTASQSNSLEHLKKNLNVIFRNASLVQLSIGQYLKHLKYDEDVITELEKYAKSFPENHKNKHLSKKDIEEKLKSKAKPEIIYLQNNSVKVSKKLRIAIVLSAIWFCIIFLVSLGVANQRNTLGYRDFSPMLFTIFLFVFGFMPILIFWGILWIREASEKK